MSIPQDGNLHVYMLNVGQADTTVIVSPAGTVIIIDAVNPDKLVNFLNMLGLDGTIEQLIITHPHGDHFRGANRLTDVFTIGQATLAPFWHEFGMGPTTYRKLVARLFTNGTDITFLSGYSRWYPDGALTTPAGGQNPEIDPGAPFLEMLGPTNGMVRRLEAAKIFDANHLTIMSRLTWRNFRMIIAGDAQLENWAFFDTERLMEDNCQVLRTSHHGSSNGTQWERIDRLDPRVVVVSSKPDGGHHLPDLGSAAIFATFDNNNDRTAVITHDTGSIHLTVDAGGNRTFEQFGDDPGDNVNLGSATAFNEQSNLTDWINLLQDRIATL